MEPLPLETACVKAETYDYPVIKAGIDRLFELLDLDNLIKPGMKVVLKPNLLMKRTPEEATTTHPALVSAVAEKALEMGAASVLLAESPGGPYTKASLNAIYQASGMTQASGEHRFSLNQDFTYRETAWSQGKVCKAFNIISPLLDADLVISLPKLKTHGMTGLSGAVKNMFGSVPGLQKPELHYRYPAQKDFTNMLIDLWECIHPAITIVDAVEAMEGNGPSGGNPKHTGLLFASQNPYTLDLALAHLIDMPVAQIPILQNAILRELCPAEFSPSFMMGDSFQPVSDFKKPRKKNLDFVDVLPGFLQKPCKWVMEKALVPNPVIRKKDCIGCGKCAESCPQHIIQIRERKAEIHNRKQCIHCYCCHEMCPKKAIDLRRFFG